MDKLDKLKAYTVNELGLHLKEYDMESATKLFLAGAFYQSADALNNIGAASEADNDYEKAFYWYNQAIEKGSKQAIINLGKMYENGRYVKQDYEKAITIYKKLLFYSDYQEEAFYRIGVCYDKQKNYLEAYKVFNKGYLVSDISPRCSFMLGYYNEFGKAGEKNLELALKMYKIASSNGNEVGSFNAARILHFGPNKDIEEAIRYYFIAINRCYLEAISDLVRMYSDNEVIESDRLIVENLLQLGCYRNHLYSFYTYAVMLYKGDFLQEDKAVAYCLFDELLERNADNDEYKNLFLDFCKEYMDDNKLVELINEYIKVENIA